MTAKVALMVVVDKECSCSCSCEDTSSHPVVEEVVDRMIKAVE
jgi:hypothetical protein